MKIKSTEHIFWLLKHQCHLDVGKMPLTLLVKTIKEIKYHWCEGKNFLANEMQMFNASMSCLKKRSIVDEYTPYRL